MAIISRENLFGKLSDFSYRAMVQGTEFCRAKGHPYLEIVHWLHQVLQQPDSDLHHLLNFFSISQVEFAHDVQQSLSRLPVKASSGLDFSLQLEDLVERGWLCATLQFNDTQIRTAHLFLGALSTPVLHNVLLAISRSVERIDSEKLSQCFDDILSVSPENYRVRSLPLEDEDIIRDKSAVSRFTFDLTAAARNGKLDPVYGRSNEIRLLMDILLRRRQNNPLLAGEAGVGKTAIVEGLALMIATDDVPPSLRETRILSLDISLMLAGAGVKGEFEQRLRQLSEEIQKAATPTLLFIDEVHMLVGAGGQAGTGDAANMLKPLLARGALRTIGATTWSEYKKHIEKDPALKRRFQVVQVAEPDPATALMMLRSVVPALETHHGVRVQPAALEAAVTLSARYLPEQKLPDKALSLLDTACAGACLAQVTPPVNLLELRAIVGSLSVGLRMAEDLVNCPDASREVATLQRTLEEKSAELYQQEIVWTEKQQQIVNKVWVGAEEVATVLQTWTGIPVTTLHQDTLERLMTLAERLSQRVHAQPLAMETIARRILTAQARLGQPDKPVGVFLLAGPSGVGKTETALALAELLYGGEKQLITINMSEYQEAHSVALLKGSPPGYVGYGEGGVLTEAVRRRPYSVVLLDEIEKAHPDVYELFFQVFDKGCMEDAEGNIINFKNTLILMTSNLGGDEISALAARQESAETMQEALERVLLQFFPAAFVGRMIAVPYLPLNKTMLMAIVNNRLRSIAERLQQRHQMSLCYDENIVDYLVQCSMQSVSGGRKVDALLTHDLLPKLSMAVLTNQNGESSVRTCHLTLVKGEMTIDVTDKVSQFEESML
ncbi:protein disaggregation chaperone [Serratia proteamaculans]|uniref:AAA family ATPase n=1 Tax=Serratia proteamaculans TaxID=28151 RepID=UPI002183FBF2|nr:AAA family ATPase [Serratia proteamaculans]CAI2398817.1 protein disaggregation chaperone [Serratia proteamaculans]